QTHVVVTLVIVWADVAGVQVTREGEQDPVVLTQHVARGAVLVLLARHEAGRGGGAAAAEGSGRGRRLGRLYTEHVPDGSRLSAVRVHRDRGVGADGDGDVLVAASMPAVVCAVAPGQGRTDRIGEADPEPLVTTTILPVDEEHARRSRS